MIVKSGKNMFVAEVYINTWKTWDLPRLQIRLN